MVLAQPGRTREQEGGVDVQWEDAIGFSRLRISPLCLPSNSSLRPSRKPAHKRNPCLRYSLNPGLVSTQFDRSYGMTVIAFSTGHYSSKQSNILPSVTLMQSPLIYFFYHFSQHPSKSSTYQLHICLTALGIFLKQ